MVLIFFSCLISNTVFRCFPYIYVVFIFVVFLFTRLLLSLFMSNIAQCTCSKLYIPSAIYMRHSRHKLLTSCLKKNLLFVCFFNLLYGLVLGVVPANDLVYITMKYSPLEFCTAVSRFQVIAL